MDMPTPMPHAGSRLASSSTERIGAGITALTAIALLTACSSGAKLDTIPADGPTMAQIYREHMAGVQKRPAAPGAAIPQRLVDATSDERYRTALATDIDQRFPRLPNPDLVMYVAPHLSASGRYPIPGYSTVFPMYESVEYAMPGEVSVPRLVDAVLPVTPSASETVAAPAAKSASAARDARQARGR